MPPEQKPDESRPRLSEGKIRKREPSRHSATEMGRRAKEIGYLGSIPILLAVGPIIGALMGQWIDERLETDPWFTAVFVILGFVASIREMLRLLKRASQSDNNKSRPKENPKKNTDQDPPLDS